MEENLDNPPTRRAAERRTRSSLAKVPKGSPASREQQQSIRLVTNARTRVSNAWTRVIFMRPLWVQLFSSSSLTLPSIHPSIHPSIYTSVHPFIHPSSDRSTDRPIDQSVAI